MEYLMDALASVIKDPLGDPFLFEDIVIQSRGMKQWISLELAQRFGICANINFSFPRDIIDRFSSQFGFDTDVLLFKIMGMLSGLASADGFEKEFAGIKFYLGNDRDGIRLYQLSSSIATLFDDYRVYRPDILLKWQNSAKGVKDKNEAIEWQAILYRKLLEEGFDFSPVVFPEKFDKRNYPERVSAFGISSYPPVFLSFFEKLSEHMDINLFLLVPSKEFFGYSTLNFSQEGDTEQDIIIEQGNPLVASLGKAGRDLQVLLEEFYYYEPLPDMWEDPLSGAQTMLSYIQSDIFNLYERKKGKDVEPAYISLEGDDSISIHACHTPMREVQVLKDQLLNLFQQNNDLAPDDVIVMLPDIESYAPLIDSVFSVEHRLPFTISDRSHKSESKTIKAFLNIIEVMSSRFELHTVLDLLTHLSVAAKFEIEPKELDVIEQYAEKAGIRWGVDAKHRKDSGLAGFDENTWLFGIKRLMLGYAMPDYDTNIFCNVLPVEFPEGLDAEIFGKFISFSDTLFKGAVFLVKSSLDNCFAHKTIGGFCRGFASVLNSMVAKTNANEKEYIFIQESIQQLERQSTEAKFVEKISFSVAFRLLVEKLSQSVSTGSFMTGGITFCNLMPMRSIPFKVVCLMGMDEQGFPRKQSCKSFDLIEKFPRAGDKNIKDEDKYLFLEALLSARENFIITYTGFNIKDNSPMPCSPIVNELLDALDASFNLKSEKQLIRNHPLQPFSSKYFKGIDTKDSGQERYFTFSEHSMKISRKIREESGERGLFLEKDLALPEIPEEAISLDTLCYFFKNPVKYILRNKMGIVLQEEESIKEDREPLLTNPLDNYNIGSRILENSFEEQKGSSDYDRFKAEGVLPFGNKGRVDLEEICKKAAPIYHKAEGIIKNEKKATHHIDITVNGINISGSIENIIEENGYFVLTFGKLKASRLLTAWIEHLAVNASLNNESSLKTVIIGANSGRSKDTVEKIIFSEVDCDEALKLLSDLVEIYKSGCIKPFVFFPETSFLFAEKYLETDQDSSDNNIYKIIQECRKKWDNSFYTPGERNNRYTDFYFGKQDLFRDVDYFRATGFIENSMKVFMPLIQYMVKETD